MSSELVAPSVFPHLIVSLLCRQSVSQKISSQKEPETLGRLGRMRGAWHEEWNPQPPRELSSVCWETLTGAKRSDGGSTWNCWTQAQQYLFPDASLESISLLGTFLCVFSLDERTADVIIVRRLWLFWCGAETAHKLRINTKLKRSFLRTFWCRFFWSALAPPPRATAVTPTHAVLFQGLLLLYWPRLFIVL